MISTAELAVVPLVGASLAGLVYWVRGLPLDFKFRTGVFWWRNDR